MQEIRLLRPDEIDVRISRVIDTGKKSGVALLLYKDARCDMNILDETFGPMNWQRHHSRDNANCIVSVWDDDKKQWIEKEDTGTESYTEAAKGLASDSFKRACFNLGIGRELYTAPDIIFWSPDAKIESKKCYDKFIVTAIEYEGRSIKSVTIEDLETEKTKVFMHKETKPKKVEKVVESVPSEEKADAIKTTEIGKLIIAPIKAQALIDKCESEGVSVSKLVSMHKGIKGVTELTESQYSNIVKNWEKVKEQCGN